MRRTSAADVTARLRARPISRWSTSSRGSVGTRVCSGMCPTSASRTFTATQGLEPAPRPSPRRLIRHTRDLRASDGVEPARWERMRPSSSRAATSVLAAGATSLASECDEDGVLDYDPSRAGRTLGYLRSIRSRATFEPDRLTGKGSEFHHHDRDEIWTAATCGPSRQGLSGNKHRDARCEQVQSLRRQQHSPRWRLTLRAP